MGFFGFGRKEKKKDYRDTSIEEEKETEHSALIKAAAAGIVQGAEKAAEIPKPLSEGHIKKGGVNPPPKVAKPKFTPLPQSKKKEQEGKYTPKHFKSDEDAGLNNALLFTILNDQPVSDPHSGHSHSCSTHSSSCSTPSSSCSSPSSCSGGSSGCGGASGCGGSG